MREILDKIKTNLVAGILIGAFTSGLTFALNYSNASKKDLKEALDSKASIEYVKESFENNREINRVQQTGNNDRIKNIEVMVTLLYENSMRGGK